jgi:hypothetical protein
VAGADCDDFSRGRFFTVCVSGTGEIGKCLDKVPHATLENALKIALCKLLKIRCRFSQKIQGTYFKISALYFKIYALCFLQQAVCLFPCRNMHVFCRIRVGEDSCEMQTTGGVYVAGKAYL